MARKKRESRNAGKELEKLKLKPVEIEEPKKREKEQPKEKSEEPEKAEEHKEEEQEMQRASQFSERILSEVSQKRFTAPILTAEEQKAENLEETAARAPAAAASQAAESKADYAPSSLSYSGSGAYEKKEEEKYRRNEDARPMFLMADSRRANAPAAFDMADSRRAGMSAAKSAEQAPIDEFARQQERYRVERQESTSLPFERKGASRRKTEIF